MPSRRDPSPCRRAPSAAGALALFLALSLALSLALVLVRPGAARAAELTVTTWGGSYAQSQRRAYGASYEEATGRVVRWEEYRGGLAEIRAQVDAGDVRWDVVDVLGHDARIGCDEGLFEPLPASLLADIEDDLVVARPNACVSPNIVWSWVTAHAGDRYADDPPRTIADFFDRARYPGTRAIGAFPQANLEMALVADGVAPSRVYDVLATPAGLDRAFGKLSQLGPDLVFWSSGEEPVDLLESGAVAFSTAYNGRIGAATLGDGVDLRTVWDGQVVEEEWFVLLAGSPNREAALGFLAHVATTARQAEQARYITYGPMRRSAHDLIAAGEPWFHNGEPVTPHLPSTRARLARSVVLDADFWARNAEAIGARFADWRRRVEN